MKWNQPRAEFEQESLIPFHTTITFTLRTPFKKHKIWQPEQTEDKPEANCVSYEADKRSKKFLLFYQNFE